MTDTPISVFGMVIVIMFIMSSISSYIPKGEPTYTPLGIKELKDYKLAVDTEVGGKSRTTERFGILYFTDGTVYESLRSCIDIKPLVIGMEYNITYIKDARRLDRYTHVPCWDVYRLTPIPQKEPSK